MPVFRPRLHALFAAALLLGALGCTSSSSTQTADAGADIQQADTSGNKTDPGQQRDPGPQQQDPGPGTDPGQNTDPGQATDPGAATDPGQATDPGAATDPGQATDPGTATDPGQATDPGSAGDTASTDPGAATDEGFTDTSSGQACTGSADCTDPNAPACNPNNLECQASCANTGCANGELCLGQGTDNPATFGACYTECQPGSTDCGTGRTCLQLDTLGLQGACLASGSAAEGEACTPSELSTGCGANLVCIIDGPTGEAVCRTMCDFFSAAPTCPSGQVCALGGVCTANTPVDPAATGASCDAAAQDFDPCGSASGRIGGVCDTDGTCKAVCRTGNASDCGAGETCVDITGELGVCDTVVTGGSCTNASDCASDAAGPACDPMTFQCTADCGSTPCAGGALCGGQGDGSVGACYPACNPTNQDCTDPATTCQQVDFSAETGFCIKTGAGATDGAPCTASDTDTGCAAGFVCVADTGDTTTTVCRATCSSFNPTPGCPSGQICAPGGFCAANFPGTETANVGDACDAASTDGTFCAIGTSRVAGACFGGTCRAICRLSQGDGDCTTDACQDVFGVDVGVCAPAPPVVPCGADPSLTCQGRCGEFDQTGTGCSCDDLCTQIGDCCADLTTCCTAAASSWATDVLPTMQSTCSGCHGNGGCTSGICWLDDFSLVIAPATNTTACAGTTDRAECMVKRMSEGSMPLGCGGPPACVPPAQIDLVQQWIDDGRNP